MVPGFVFPVMFLLLVILLVVGLRSRLKSHKPQLPVVPGSRVFFVGVWGDEGDETLLGEFCRMFFSYYYFLIKNILLFVIKKTARHEEFG